MTVRDSTWLDWLYTAMELSIHVSKWLTLIISLLRLGS